jgi:hypothetical protein
MLPDLTLPASLAGLLMMLRPVFTGPSFATFCGLAAGLAGQVRRRTVCGMLLGAGLSRCWPHDRAHYYFARAAWDLDELGLAVARIVVALLVPAGAAITVAVDDSVFRRSGRRVFGAAWQHDGSSPAKNKLSYGTCFVTAGIVVALPFCSRPVCLPVLARLHVPGRGRARKPRRQAAPASTVSCAAALVSLLAAAFPGRRVDVVADAHYHGPALRDLPASVTWTTRLPRNAVLFAPAPPRVRKPGRPPRKGPRLGTPAELAAAASWAPAVVRIYGRDTAGDLAEVTCLWYGCLDVIPVRVIPARDPARQIALVTTDLDTPPPPWSSGTPPAGPSSRPSPTPATSSAPARPAPGPAAPSSAPSRSPCSCTPSSSPGTPATATTGPASPNAAPPSPGTGPRPGPPSRTC